MAAATTTTMRFRGANGGQPAETDWSLYGGAETLGPAAATAALSAQGGPSSSSSTAVRGPGTTASTSASTTPPISLSGSSHASDDESERDESSGSSSSESRSVAFASSQQQQQQREEWTRPKLAGEQWAPRVVEPRQDTHDFLWLMTEEPHRSRRKAILKAHPEVTKLMGYEPLTKYVVLFVTALQFYVAYSLRDASLASWRFWALAYVIGATANQNAFLAIHEITHNLAFRSVKANRAFAIFANLPVGVPFAMMFKKYHIEHHKALGEDGIDTDLPTKLELIVLRNVLGKCFFATFQIFFYALRPGFVRAQAITRWTLANIAIVLLSDYILVQLCGWRSLAYFLASSFLAGSLHPCAGHFIAEHYLFDGHDQETWSYYGPLNILAYNVGYHNEHHDFPSVAWTRLPALRKLASEYYDPLPQHDSWPGVTWRFITETDVGLWSRAKRNGKGVSRWEATDDAARYEGDAGGLKD